MSTFTEHSAAAAYAELAPHYDILTRRYQHDRWLTVLESLAVEHGLQGRRVLDVACGTGKSFLPLLRRGYDVVGCDISEEMLAVARERAGSEVELFQADVRALPEVGPFDLVTWLDDAVNYLLGDDDLELAIVSIAQTMAPGGLLVFDANTLSNHRRMYASAFVVDEDVFLCWHGQQVDDQRPGAPGVATVEIFRPDDAGWSRQRSVHCQRWWGEADVRRAGASAGLDLVAIRGQHPGARLEPEASEDVHSKIVYLAHKPFCRTTHGTEGGTP
jgi:SAM-dependent methyltransferase